jgi:hypothetical protein
MIGPAMDEVLASLQHLRREHDAGRSLWRSFWGIAPTPETQPQTQTQRSGHARARPGTNGDARPDGSPVQEA